MLSFQRLIDISAIAFFKNITYYFFTYFFSLLTCDYLYKSSNKINAATDHQGNSRNEMCH